MTVGRGSVDSNNAGGTSILVRLVAGRARGALAVDDLMEGGDFWHSSLFRLYSEYYYR